MSLFWFKLVIIGVFCMLFEMSATNKFSIVNVDEISLKQSSCLSCLWCWFVDVCVNFQDLYKRHKTVVVNNVFIVKLLSCSHKLSLVACLSVTPYCHVFLLLYQVFLFYFFVFTFLSLLISLYVNFSIMFCLISIKVNKMVH